MNQCVFEWTGLVVAEQKITKQGFFVFGTVYISNRHAILGKRAGLIRADNGGTAECFHGRKMADNGTLFCHALNAKTQHNGNEGWQTFRNGCDAKTDGSHKHIKNWLIFLQSQEK